MNQKNILLASTVAGLLLTGCGSSEDTASKTQSVKCQGINECKGLGECAGKNTDGTSHDCQGKGSCKGQGWVTVPDAKTCTDKGGKVLGG